MLEDCCPNDPQPGVECAELVLHLARVAQGGAVAGDLTPAQWTALRYFARANRFSRTPSAFSQFHATTRGTASQTVKSLVTLGFLVRQVNSADGRSTLFSVTDAGRARLQDDPLGDLAAVLDDMPKDMRAAFTAALQRAAAALARRRAMPVFGNCRDCGHCEQGGTDAYCHCTQSDLMQAEMLQLCVDFRPSAARRQADHSPRDSRND